VAEPDAVDAAPPGGRYCPSCGLPLRLLWLHGHGECELCHTVLEECCQGSGQETTTRRHAGDHPPADRCDGSHAAIHALCRILDHGESRVLLRETLLNRLCATTGVTWAEAEQILADAVRSGALVADRRSGGLRLATGRSG